MRRQQGGVVPGMIMLILLLGTALLNASRQQLNASLALVADERQAIIGFRQAQSALTWGLTLRWAALPGWQCQYQAQYNWRACLLRPQANRGLLRAEQPTQGEATLALFHWVIPTAQGGIQAAKGGWVDFCPLSEEERCEAETTSSERL
ncbi:DUF2509 family protein [Paramixta manurensis]